MSLLTDPAPPSIEKSIFVKDLKPFDEVQSTFLVKSKGLPLSRNGKPYLAMHLKDKTGEIDARLWEDAEKVAQCFSEGDVVAVGGRVNAFQNRIQLIIEHLTPISSVEVRWDNYLPQAKTDLEALYSELLNHFRELKNPWIKRVALEILETPDIATRMKICPAGKTVHHAFVGGLLVHAVQLIRIAKAIHPYYPGIDLDLVIFGCAFHDFGKIYELSYHGDFQYTDEGRLVGHISIACIILDRHIQKIEGFPKEIDWHLKHLILSHHGHLEYGSPKTPQTLEAELVHHLDYMDSRLDGIQTFIEQDQNTSRWTSLHKTYNQYYWKKAPEPQ